MEIGRKTIILTDDENFNQAVNCWSVSFTNKGTAKVWIDDFNELSANESFVFPVVAENHYYSDGFKIRFDGTGTKKLIVSFIYPRP